MNLEDKRHFDQACAENLDANNMHRIDRENRRVQADRGLDERGRKLAHAPGPTIEMCSVAELERQWSEVASVISGCRMEIEEAVNTRQELTCEQKDVLREAAAALAPAAYKAMHTRTTHRESYRVLFDQFEGSRL